jgi:hypothetical protein
VSTRVFVAVFIMCVIAEAILLRAHMDSTDPQTKQHMLLTGLGTGRGLYNLHMQ